MNEEPYIIAELIAQDEQRRLKQKKDELHRKSDYSLHDEPMIGKNSDYPKMLKWIILGVIIFSFFLLFRN